MVITTPNFSIKRWIRPRKWEFEETNKMKRILILGCLLLLVYAGFAFGNMTKLKLNTGAEFTGYIVALGPASTRWFKSAAIQEIDFMYKKYHEHEKKEYIYFLVNGFKGWFPEKGGVMVVDTEIIGAIPADSKDLIYY